MTDRLLNAALDRRDADRVPLMLAIGRAATASGTERPVALARRRVPRMPF